MKAAILKCDDMLEKFQPEFKSYSNMIFNMFHRVDETLRFEIFDCQLGLFPENVENFDFFIITGSKADSYSDLKWIKQLIQFVKELNAKNKKLIGICFGHQIMALALGGNVSKSSKGWGVGVTTNNILEKPDWMNKAVSELNIIVSHQDQVDDIPDGSSVLAESDFCPYFIVQWNDHFLSIQGHPEWNKEYSNVLMDDRVDRIPAETIASGKASLTIEPDNQIFTQWMLDFVQYRAA